MTIGLSKGALALALLALAGTSQAAAPAVPDTLRACQQEPDVLKRLACYDSEMTRATSQAAPLPAPAAAPAAAAPARTPFAATAAATVRPTAAAPAAATEAPRGNVATRFLRSLTPSKGPKKDASETSETARIASVRPAANGLSVITLDNGQVWRQMEAETYFPLDAGDTVRIETGALGSYRLTRVEEGWKRFMRVSLVSMGAEVPVAAAATAAPKAAAPMAIPAPAPAPAPKAVAPMAIPAPAPAAGANATANAGTGGRISGFASGLMSKLTPGSGGKKATDAEISDTARITALQTVGAGMALITLDNGQQWKQQEAMAYFPLAIGDTIRIEKGALGSYRLTRVEEGWKTFMRVSRTK